MKPPCEHCPFNKNVAKELHGAFSPRNASPKLVDKICHNIVTDDHTICHEDENSLLACRGHKIFKANVTGTSKNSDYFDNIEDFRKAHGG